MKKLRQLQLGLAILLLAGCGGHPKDAELQVVFQKNIAALSSIVAELKTAPTVERVEWKDGNLIVNSSEVNPPALTQKLVPHFKAIGQPLLVISAGNGSQLMFCFSIRGVTISGSMKGVVYQETKPDRMVTDTDSSSQANAPFTVFRPLQEKWFIFFSH